MRPVDISTKENLADPPYGSTLENGLQGSLLQSSMWPTFAAPARLEAFTREVRMRIIAICTAGGDVYSCEEGNKDTFTCFSEAAKPGQNAHVPWIVGTKEDGTTIEFNVSLLEWIERTPLETPHE